MSTLLPILFTLTSLSTHEQYHGPSPWLFGFLILIACAFGDTLDYVVGRLSEKILHHWRFIHRFVNEDDIHRGEVLFKEKGASAIMMMAPVPVLHSTVSLAAGALHYTYARFIAYNTLANVVLVVTCIILSQWFGQLPFVHHHLIICTTLVFILLLILFIVLKKVMNPSTKS